MFHKYRNNHPKVFFTNDDGFKVFSKFKRKRLCRSLTLEQYCATSWLKRDSNTGFFLWVFKNTYFYAEAPNMLTSIQIEIVLSLAHVVKLHLWADEGQLTNYLIITYFFVIFWLQTNVTKKWPFYNVISVRNSNLPKCNVILTSSKNVIASNK